MFYEELGRTPLEMRKLWMRVQLSGEGRAPVTLSSETEVAEKVASTPGAIGFVRADLVPINVKDPCSERVITYGEQIRTP